MTLAIQTENLVVCYRGHQALCGLNLEVEAGEVFGFLGPNGAGKTTAIRVLLDLLRPDQGTARVLGTTVRDGGGELRSRIGFLPGDLRLFPRMTGIRALQFLEQLQGRPARSRQHVLQTLGFPESALTRKVRSYSTGMRQMIGIAGAFQHDPELLILDEPTTGLDPLVRQSFLELVRQRKESGATVFLSSHVLDEVERCADRVGFLSGGRLPLVDSVRSIRARRPRTVLLRYADGTEQEELTSVPAEQLLADIDARGLIDVEIRPASLDDVFGTIVSDEEATR